MGIRNYLSDLRHAFMGTTPNGQSLAASQLRQGEVRIDAVGKRFRKRSQSSSYSTLKSGMLASAEHKATSQQQAAQEQGYFHALKDVSIHVEPGCALGVIGRNGSGKSTLLKLISGIYLPDSGSVLRKGRISALIELGAGFHPDFTGRENVYLGGVMYGLSRKEIDERFDAIVRYAELEDCIDDPVRTYSSGMYMRLGFSLAVHTDPDILLVDEVLAVGDAAFISKCQDTISELKRRGKTLIFVTHDLPSVVRWCDEVVWLAEGDIRDRGEPRRVIDAYLAEVEETHKDKLDEENAQNSSGAQRGVEDKNRWGSGAVELYDVVMQSDADAASWLFHQEDAVRVRFRYRINEPIPELVFGIGIERVDGLTVYGSNTAMEQIELAVPAADASYPVEGEVEYEMQRIGLVEGSYYLDLAAHREDGFSYDYHHRIHKFSVRSEAQAVGVYAPKHRWILDCEQESMPADYASDSADTIEKRRRKIA